MHSCCELALGHRSVENQGPVKGQPSPGGLVAKTSGPGQILKNRGVSTETETDLLARERAGKRASPRARLSRRAAPGDRQEATKLQHKQETGPLVTGWGPARAGKSPGGRAGGGGVLGKPASKAGRGWSLCMGSQVKMALPSSSE